MLALIKRYRLRAPAVLGVLALVVALYAQFSLDALPRQFQYLWLAPAPVAATGEGGSATNDGLRDARLNMPQLREQLAGACEPLTLYAVADGVSVIADRENATAATTRLEAIDDGAFALKPLLLTSGRLIYPEEFERGAHVAIVEEKLAVALFNYAEPIDRLLLLNGESYRIVGVAKGGRSVGDRFEHTLYIPYRTAEKSSLTFSALCLQARPVPGSGGWSAFESATAGLGGDGTCLSLTKEAMNAALPLRVVGSLIGLLALLGCLRLLNAQVRRLYARWKLRLRDHYALRLLPWLSWRGALLALGYAACAVAFAQLFIWFVAPVYTFPEWIPKVLVEPADIETAFWNVWQKQASVLSLRSPEVIRAQFFGRVMGWACGALMLAAGLLVARLGDALSPLTARTPPDAPLEEK